MEFWGVEVKPKQSVKCEAGDDKILHLSQASLGEIKKDKGSENVPVFVKVNDKKLVLGTLSAENCAQIQYDLVFEKEFELSHGSKDTSVFFVGYKSTMQDLGSEDDFSDYDSDEDLQLNEKDVVKNYQETPIAVKAAAVKDNSASAKSKPQPEKPDKAEKPKAADSLKKDKDGDEDEDDDSEEESDDDEEITKGMISSDDEDEEDDDDDDDSSEDEKIKSKAENGKKRSADGLTKHSADKKAKLAAPVVKQKPDKGRKAAAPPSAKQAGKTPASGGKAKEQSPKSTGSHKCNSCSKPFNSENALQAHTKAKHSTSK